MKTLLIGGQTAEGLSGIAPVIPAEQPITALRGDTASVMCNRTCNLIQRDTDEDNRLKLKALVTLFGVSLADIARVAGCSRPLVSRIMNRDAGVNPQSLYSKLEPNIARLIERKQKAFFSVESVSAEEVQHIIQKVERTAA